MQWYTTLQTYCTPILSLSLSLFSQPSCLTPRSRCSDLNHENMALTCYSKWSLDLYSSIWLSYSSTALAFNWLPLCYAFSTMLLLPFSDARLMRRVAVWQHFRIFILWSDFGRWWRSSFIRWQRGRSICQSRWSIECPLLAALGRSRARWGRIRHCYLRVAAVRRKRRLTMKTNVQLSAFVRPISPSSSSPC